jgi:hypothetical protein
MRYEYDKLPKLAQYFLVEAATKLADQKGVEDVTSLWPDMFDNSEGKKEWEFTITVNGIELPTVPFFEALEDSMDRNIEAKAVELLNIKFIDLYDAIDAVEEAVKEQFKKRFPQYKTNEDGYYELKEE